VVKQEFVLNNVTVVLIDMQSLFVNNLRPGCADSIIPAQKKVLETCRDFGIPVIVVEMVGAGKTIAPLLEVVLECPKRDFVYKGEVSKPTCDGFSNPLLLRKLQERNTSYILCMGINAAYCIMATILSAIRHEMQVILSPDVIGGADSTPMFTHPRDDCIPYFRSIGVGVFSDAGTLISILTSQRRVT